MALEDSITKTAEADTGGVRTPWGARLVSGFERFTGAISDTILPPLCLGCRAQVMTHDALCPACWRQIAFIRAPVCDRLGIPMPFDAGPGAVSAAAEAQPPDYDRARAVALYDGLMRKLVHNFKFNDTQNARRLFGRWLADAGQELLEDTDLLVPVPLSRWRLLTRRFNQAQLLAAEIARITPGTKIDPFALERKWSARQVGLTRRQRQRNAAGVFLVPERAKSQIAGKSILLIDDVITTGATASAAARTLKKAGAARVEVLALALVTSQRA